MAAADTSTFERALTHPMFDSMCSKVFAVDKALEIRQGFKARFSQIVWEKFETDDAYLDVDVSMRLINHLLTFHGYDPQTFVADVWAILTLRLQKRNLLFFQGVPNSGKSFIARMIAALYKYPATVQGTTSFPFMELAHCSFGLIEEPSFTDEALQTFKKLAEGTETEVSVKNKGAARVPRIPLIVTANYPFWKDGGALERQAFASRMIEYKFTKPAGFLKMAKKPLNPAIWKNLLHGMMYPVDDDVSTSSGDNELCDFLDVVEPDKRKSGTSSGDEPPVKKTRWEPEDDDTLTIEDVILAEAEEDFNK